MRRQGCSTGNLSRIGRLTELGGQGGWQSGGLRAGGETKALGELQALATMEPAVMHVNTRMCAHNHTGTCMHRHTLPIHSTPLYFLTVLIII